MPNKILISNLNVTEDNKTLTFDTQPISTVFKNFFSNLAEYYLGKLSDPPDKYDLNDFCLNNTSEDKFLKLKKRDL